MILHKNYIFSIISIIFLFLVIGCSSPEDKAKKEIEKRLTERGKIENLNIETYQGIMPTVLDKKLLENAKEYVVNRKTSEYLETRLAEIGKPANYGIELVYNQYRREMYKSQLQQESDLKKIKADYDKLEKNKTSTNSIIAMIEYDIDDARKKEHKKEIIIVDKEDPSRIIGGITLTDKTPQRTHILLQAVTSDTIILTPTKEELRSIVSKANDPAINYIFKDSI